MTFYEMVLDSDEIGDFFEGIDMAKLMDHQTKFIASLLGGPAAFSDKRLQQVHRHLNIGHADFDEVAKLLTSALRQHNVGEPDIEHVLQQVESKRSIIVASQAA